MEKIIITIPDNLTQEQEFAMIAQQLGKKLLPANNVKKIGIGYTVKHAETQIVIKREPTEKPIITHECGVCRSVFEKSIGKYLWTDYGGKVRRILYCSEYCCTIAIDMCSNRAAFVRKDLSINNWHKRRDEQTTS